VKRISFLLLFIFSPVIAAGLSLLFASPAQALTSSSWATESVAIDPDTYGTTDMVEYNDALYVSLIPGVPGPVGLENENGIIRRSTRGDISTTDQSALTGQTHTPKTILDFDDIPLFSKRNATWIDINTADLARSDNTVIIDMCVYNGKLAVGTENLTFGAEVWLYDGTTWEAIGQVVGGNPWDAENYAATAVAVLNNYLYVGFNNNTTGAEVWRYNGTTWTQVNLDGFGDANNEYLDSMTVHNSKLYAGVYEVAIGGVRVYRYDGGTSWIQINVDGFGDANTNGIYALTSHSGALYAGVEDSAGAEVWRYNDTGTNWTMINIHGFGNAGQFYLGDLTTYNSHLYASAGGDTAEVWRWNGSSWART
jgi:hypothetical protein